MKRVSESYPSRFAKPSDYPLAQRMRLQIRAVIYEEDFEYGPRYCLELTELDGRPWAGGQLAIMPPGQAKILGFNFGDAPEGWYGHTIELWPEQISVKGQLVTTWRVMPVYLQPGVAAAPPATPPAPPAPAIVAPAATRPKRAAPPPAAEADDLAAILNDEVPTFDTPQPPAAGAVTSERSRSARRSGKESR
jgi:hypothetical protein